MPFVVGRVRVDNYLMGLCDIAEQCTVIDGTSTVTGIHIGMDSQDLREGGIDTGDQEWKIKLIEQQINLLSYLTRPFRRVVVRNSANRFVLKRRWGSVLLSI